jgi:hypothetical protein
VIANGAEPRMSDRRGPAHDRLGKFSGVIDRDSDPPPEVVDGEDRA